MLANLVAIVLDICVVAQLSEWWEAWCQLLCGNIVVADILPQLSSCLASAAVAWYEFQGMTILNNWFSFSSSEIDYFKR